MSENILQMPPELCISVIQIQDLITMHFELYGFKCVRGTVEHHTRDEFQSMQSKTVTAMWR